MKYAVKFPNGKYYPSNKLVHSCEKLDDATLWSRAEWARDLIDNIYYGYEGNMPTVVGVILQEVTLEDERNDEEGINL